MNHGQTLPLPRCPHCNVAKPLLRRQNSFESSNDRNQNRRLWGVYNCETCGGVTLAVAVVSMNSQGHPVIKEIHEIWPTPQTVDQAVPERSRKFLDQAIASIHAPSGAVMLAASAVDSMLKEKGLKEGSLHSRIVKAAADHLITAEMAAWAHEVRLDANDQRHADEEAALPDEADAEKSIEFAIALAQFLFVLPARVSQGRGR